jgi:zinc protease
MKQRESVTLRISAALGWKAAAAITLSSMAPAEAAVVPPIAVESYRLSNGLQVVLQPDRTVPTVHVEVLYEVGSGDEARGRTGLAHLFEHLMFQGTRHIPEGGYIQYLSEAGASLRNASTGYDVTNYFEALPREQVELGLWLESSRMGFLLDRPSFWSAVLRQREVVKNEWRQRVENAPLGGVRRAITEALYPEGHPYHHDVAGAITDLDALTLADVRAFFARYYAPNNAILLLAGDLDLPATKRLVERYFGPIPRGRAVVHRAAPAAGFSREKRVQMEARVNLPSEFMVWHTSPIFQPGDAEMNVAARILGDGKTSRLYRRLVYDQKLAESVSVTTSSLLLGGQLEIVFKALRGHSLGEIERAVDDELEKLRLGPVDEEELTLAKNQIRSDFVRSLEPLNQRASRLLTYAYKAQDPDFLPRDLARYDQVDRASLQRHVARLLTSDNRLVITVETNPQAPLMGRIKSR